MDAIWFFLGIVVGAAIAWFFLQRLSDRRVAEAERRVADELAHAQEQARDADLAHAETKERLIALQARLQALEAERERERAELVACRERLVQLESRAAALAETQARLERLEAELARERAASPVPPATAPAADKASRVGAAEPAPPAPQARSADAADRLRRLDAKLAMLPAGSSARALLLKERAALVARIDQPPVRVVEPPPPAPVAPPPPDDLKRIKGIGPVIERRLHELGVRTFADLAALTPERVKQIDEAIEFPGRIERERWIEQAKQLLAGRGAT